MGRVTAAPLDERETLTWSTFGTAARELAVARWGLRGLLPCMPTPPKFLQGKKTDPGVANIRNVASSHWRRWLGPENRCVVPFTSFSEPEPQPGGKRPPAWFALGEDRPLAFFAGIKCIAPGGEGRRLHDAMAPAESRERWIREIRTQDAELFMDPY